MANVSDWPLIKSPIALPKWAELRADNAVWAVWVPNETVHVSNMGPLTKETLQVCLRILSDSIFDKKYPGQISQMQRRKMGAIARGYLSRGVETESVWPSDEDIEMWAEYNRWHAWEKEAAQ